MKSKNKKEILFIVTSIFLLLIIIGFSIYSINFLAQNTKKVLDQETTKTTKEITKFNWEGLKKLGIIKEKQE